MDLKIGFLGLGRMGGPMALHVLAAGNDLTVWNRSTAKAQPFGELGVQVAATPAEAAAGRDVVVLMLTDLDAVQQVLFGKDGVVTSAEPSTLVIDASTLGPDGSRAMASRLSEYRIRYVDAPVFGSVGPATEGTLGVFAGGESADVAAALPVLHLWAAAEQVFPVGAVGTGSAAKLVRNLTLCLALAGIGEALRLGEALGLPRETTRQVVAASTLGGSFEGVRRLDDEGAYVPANFTIRMLSKDLGLCLSADQHLGMAAAARAAAERAISDGFGHHDSRSLALHLRDER